jgi:hypothetical protein
MASTKSSRSAKQSGSRGRASSRGKTRRQTSSAKSTTDRKASAPRRRRTKAKPPSTQERVVGAVRSAKVPGLAAGAAVLGGVALAVRRRRSSGFDARALAKRVGKTTRNLGKTSKQLGEEIQKLGDDAESVGKTLS